MKALLLGLGIMLSAGLARAEAPPPEQPKVGNDPLSQTEEDPWDKGVPVPSRQAAAKLFGEANLDLNASLTDKAVEKYSTAVKMWPHPMIHYNLALALLSLDRPIEVEIHLKKAIEFGLDGLNKQKEKLERANQLLLLNEKQLANVVVACNKVGAKVSVDGKEVFVVQAGQANVYKGRIKIGKHTFVAEKQGYATAVDAPFIEPGHTFNIELTLYTALELTQTKRRWPKRTWAPWVVVAGGAAVGIVAGVMQLSANQNYNDFDEAVARCNAEAGSAGCDTEAAGIADLRESGDTKRTLGIIGYSVAGAAVVTGALLVYLNRTTSYQITTDEYRLKKLRERKAVTLVPLVEPGAGGAMVMGRF